MTIRLHPSQKSPIHSSTDIFNLLQPILRRASKLDRNREHCWLLCLDQSHKVLHLELMSLGTVRSVLIDPMEVYSVAIAKRASAVVIVHNHPSGNLKPSFGDTDMTNLLQQCGRMLRIVLLDHLIISETGFYSFCDSGELARLAISKEYLIKHPLQEEFRKMAGLPAEREDLVGQVAYGMRAVPKGQESKLGSLVAVGRPERKSRRYAGVSVR